MQVEEVSQALLGKTRTRILTLLLEHQEMTAVQLARKLGIIEPGVRKHLENLRKIGMAESFFKQEGKGRPKKFYKVTPLGRSVFPKRYDRFLNLLISKLDEPKHSANAGTQTSPTAMSQVVTDLANEFRAKNGLLPIEKKIRALDSFLNELGFTATVRRESNGSVSIARSDCALYNVALHNHKKICLEFDTALISECLDSEFNVELRECMALGKKRCEHLITLQEAPPATRQ